MTRVFSARNDAEAEFVRAALDGEGITAKVEGAALAGGIQILGESLPTVWVEDADAARAAAIVEALPHGQAQADVSDKRTWACPNCGEQVGEEFDACWKCSTARPPAAGT